MMKIDLKEIAKDAKENGFFSIKIDLNKEKTFNNHYATHHFIRYIGLLNNGEILLAQEKQESGNGYAKERARAAQRFFSSRNIHSCIYDDGKELR